MREEAFQRAAEELLQDAVDAGATESERRRLRASRDAIVIRLGYDYAGDGSCEVVMEPAGSGTPASDAERPAERPELAAIYRRIGRRELGLPTRECVSLRQREGCRCLSAALDEASEDATKAEVKAAAKTLHRQLVVERKRREREPRTRCTGAANGPGDSTVQASVRTA